MNVPQFDMLTSNTLYRSELLWAAYEKNATRQSSVQSYAHATETAHRVANPRGFRHGVVYEYIEIDRNLAVT